METKEKKVIAVTFFFLKKEASALLREAGVTMPKTLKQNDGFIAMITDPNAKVKKKIQNVTYSQQFKRWFGDWINHSRFASKIVNPDGTPRIVYHQTGAEIEIFDNSHPGHGKYDSETPNGYFFKDGDADIGLEGKKQMATYLNIRRPLRFANREAASKWYAKHIAGYAAAMQKIQKTDQKYQSIYAAQEAENDAFYDANYDAIAAEDPEIMRQLEEQEKKLDRIMDQWEEEDNRHRMEARDLLTDYFVNHDSGYDGIILEFDARRNGVDVKTYITFKKNQQKSATENIGTYDRKSDNFYRSTQDADYLAAAERGDEAAAQRMVDAKAEQALADSKARSKNGMLEKVYHGTTELEQINVFHRGKRGNLGPGIYVTTDEAYAKRYADAMGDGGKVYTGYIDLKNPIVCTSSEPAREILRAIYGSDAVYNRRIRTQTNAASILTQADIRKGLQKGFDGVVWDLGSKEYAVWNPEQIKSADPVTYDDDGNVIPLSARFDQTKEDFRYSTQDDEATKAIKDQIRAHIQEIEQNGLLASATVDRSIPRRGDLAAKWVMDQLKPFGYAADRQSFGRVVFDQKRIAKAIRYLNTNEERAAFVFLPKIIKRGVQIDSHEQHKGRQTVDSYTFAGKVNLNGQDGMMAVVVHKTSDLFYYVHRIIMPDGSNFMFEEKERSHPKGRGAASSDAGHTTGGMTSEKNDTTSGTESQEQFSTKGPVDFIAARTAAAMQENLEFRAIVETLLDDYDRTGADAAVWKKANVKETAKITRDLLRKYGSKYDLQEATDQLTRLYEIMRNGSDPGSADQTDVLTGMFMLAKSILTESRYKNTELYDQFKDVREYLKGVKLWISPTMKAEIEAAYGDYNTYRSAMFGKVNGMSLSDRSGRMSMDELWQELNTLAPEYFPLDTNEGDMPGKLAWFFEATAPRIENPYNNGEADINETAAVLCKHMETKRRWPQSPSFFR